MTEIYEVKRILEELRRGLLTLYGTRLKQLILYGSWAREEASDESDIDVVVVLDGEIMPGREIDRMIDIITELNLRYDTLLSVYPVSEKDYQKIKSPLMLRVREEGIVL